MIEFFLFFNIVALLGVWLAVTLMSFQRSRKQGLYCLAFPPYAFVMAWQISKLLLAALVVAAAGFVGTLDNLGEFLARPKYQGEVIKNSERAQVLIKSDKSLPLNKEQVDILLERLSKLETWKVKSFEERRIAIRANIGRKPGYFGNGFFPTQPGDKVNRYRVILSEKVIMGYGTFERQWTKVSFPSASSGEKREALTIAETQVDENIYRSHLILPLSENLFLEVTEVAEGHERKMTQRILDEIVAEVVEIALKQ